VRRFRVEISRSGAVFVALTILLGAGAANTNNNLLYLVTSAMLSLMAISGMSSLVNLLGLELTLELPEELYAGLEAPVRVRLRNRKRHLPSFLLWVEAQGARCLLMEVPPGATGEGILWVRPPGRGPWRWRHVSVWSGFPLGLFRRCRPMEVELEPLVFPRPLPAAAPFGDPQDRWGDRDGRRRGWEGDLRGIREHQPLEDIRYIHWKASARAGRLLTKELEAWAPPTALLRLEEGLGLEEALGRLCWLVLELSRRGWWVGLELPGVCLNPACGWEHRRRLLRTLALYGHESRSA